MNPKLIVEQKITPFANQYSVYESGADGSKGNLLAFAQQKRLAFKEKVNFYSDKEKTQLVFSFRAERVMDIHGRFIVEDAAGKTIGGFRKDFKQSLLKSTWHIIDNDDQPSLTLSESNQILAIIRRFGGLIPIIGSIIELIVAFFRYHFVIKTAAGEVVGRYEKTALFRDHYKLSITEDVYQAHDWRVLAALTVALDALQSR